MAIDVNDKFFFISLVSYVFLLQWNVCVFSHLCIYEYFTIYTPFIHLFLDSLHTYAHIQTPNKLMFTTVVSARATWMNLVFFSALHMYLYTLGAFFLSSKLRKLQNSLLWPHSSQRLKSKQTEMQKKKRKKKINNLFTLHTHIHTWCTPIEISPNK